METNSQITIGPKPIGTVQENDKDSIDEYIGHLIFSTTGDVLVPREWLRKKWNEYNIPQNLFPRKPSRWSAYRRTMNRLLDEPEFKFYNVFNESYGRYFNCKFEIDSSDEKGSNVFILYSKVFFPEEVIGEEGGDWRRQRVCHFDFYHPEDDMPGQLLIRRDIEQDNIHYDAVKSVGIHANELFKKMQEYHNYSDMQKVIDQFRSSSNSIPIRRGVYFIGSHHEETMKSLSKLWEDLNEYKDDGEKVRIESTPVVNLESQREMIAERAKKIVEDIVDDIVSNMMNKFETDDDMTAEKTSRKILEQLSETHEISNEYNSLLSMRLSVKDILKERRKEMKEDQEEIIDSVLEQTTLSQ